MAVIATEKTAPEWFTPADQKKEAEPAQYRVRPVNQVQLTEVVPGVNWISGKIEGWAVQRLLQYGLMDWRGIKQEDGQDLEYERSNLRLIPYHHQTEAASHILFISTLSEEEIKNS